MEQVNLETLFDLRQAETLKLFQEIHNNAYHKLHKFLPEANNCSYNLRNTCNHKIQSQTARMCLLHCTVLIAHNR